MRLAPLRTAVLVAVVAVSLLVSCGASGGSDAGDEAATAGPTTTTAPDETTDPAEPADAVTTTTLAEDEATTTTEVAADGGEICELMANLRDSDKAANDLVAGGDWPQIQAFYVESTDAIVANYDAAIALDTEITAELETLRGVTVAAGDLAAESTSLVEYGTKLASQPGIGESTAAALAANEFTQETCGFSLAGF